MRLFSARLDIVSYAPLGNGRFEIEAKVIDNTGMYRARSVQVGDIIYVSGLTYGYDILRYCVTEKISSSGVVLKAIVDFDMPFADFDPIAPFGDAIIGARHTDSLTANIVDVAVNLANQKLVADASNYQQILTNVGMLCIINHRSSDVNFVHHQDSPSDCWEIKHNLKKHPSVSVVDTEGRVVICDVQYLNTDEITITFGMPFAGKAYLN